jgi:hypothetical protein
MDEFFFAFTELLEAQRDHDKARDEDCYSWGYFGQRYEDAINNAKERFTKAFRDAVLAVVKEGRS